MSTTTRRDFIKLSSTAILASAIGALRCAKLKSDIFRYAFCNESMKGMPWEKQCELTAQAGYTGIEIAAFTLVTEGVSEITPNRRKEMVKAMENVGISCAGLHWLFAPPPQGLHCTTSDESVRIKTWAYLDELIDFCADLGGTVMIFGSPKQRDAASVGISVEEAVRRLTDGLANASDHAQNRGVKILLEVLDHTQTDVVNTSEQAMAILKEINHPAIQTMFDFHNTVDETEPFDVIIKKYYPYIHHVHVQEMDGKYLGIGNGANDFVKAFQTLKDSNYDKWVSLEVFDFAPGPETIAKESMETLKQIEKKLS